MNYFSDICDRTSKVKFKKRHFRSLKRDDFEKCNQIKHTIQSLDIFDIDSIFKKTSLTAINKSNYSS